MGLKGFVSRLLSFTRVTRNGAKITDVKVDPGGGPNVTGEHFADSGDDSHPLSIDYPFFVPTKREGVSASVGYIDPINNKKTSPGGKRIYGRDENGAVVNEVWLKNDGTIFVNNDSGSIEIKPTGQIESINAGGSIILKPSGELESTATTKMSLTAPDVEITGATKIIGALEVIGGISNTGALISSNGIVLDTHTHNIIGGSSAPGPTAGPN